MKLLKEILVSLLISLMISHGIVMVYLAFGPVFVNGELAILRGGVYKMAVWAVVFWPVLFIRRRRSKRKP